MNIKQLMKQAQQMQEQMQQRLATVKVEGSAGGGMVKAEMSGNKELVAITIDKEAVDPDDVEMLQDLITAAVNDGVHQVKEVAAQKMNQVTGGLRIPGLIGGVAALIEPVARLIEALSRLPGVGPKTAQRLTYHLLRAPEAEARALAAALIAVRDEVVYCESCFNISTGPLCPICADPGRDDRRVCVVEEPLDVLALERTGEFRGRYHVLHGGRRSSAGCRASSARAGPA